MQNLAPIVLFVYNRPELTTKTLNTLKENTLASRSDLFVFSDGSKGELDREEVLKVREIIDNITGFKLVKVFKSDSNRGLANSVIHGVTEIINEYNSIIVLEDDLITAPNFLEYMNEALIYFENNKKIWSVSGYTPLSRYNVLENQDIYFTGRASSWGWATWKDRWNLNNWNIEEYKEIFKNKKMQMEFNGNGNDLFPMLKDQKRNRINSWAIRWCYNQFLNKAYTVYPVSSLVTNEGLTGESTHGSMSNQAVKLTCKESFEFCDYYESTNISKEFKNHYDLKLYNHVGFLLKNLGLYKIAKKYIKKVL